MIKWEWQSNIEILTWVQSNNEGREAHNSLHKKLTSSTALLSTEKWQCSNHKLRRPTFTLKTAGCSWESFQIAAILYDNIHWLSLHHTLSSILYPPCFRQVNHSSWTTEWLAISEQLLLIQNAMVIFWREREGGRGISSSYKMADVKMWLIKFICTNPVEKLFPFFKNVTQYTYTTCCN